VAAVSFFTRWRRLARCERRLLATAWLELVVVAPALAVLPFRLLREWAEGGSATRSGARPPEPERAAALVEAAAAHHLLGATCLARALVLCRLLRRRGFPARLCLGTARTGELFEAHAWVECDGRPLTAGGSIERFEALLPDTAATIPEGRR
jgi:hypothetical protein